MKPGKEEMKFTRSEVVRTKDTFLPLMSEKNVHKALSFHRSFHRSFPQYSVTPLSQLKQMAAYLGLKNLFVKDESYRFGLNAFKLLGGSYAMARYIAKETGRSLWNPPTRSGSCIIILYHIYLLIHQ